MTQIVSSISGIQIYAPSAGYAPLDSAGVSAIASAYQVVSATATQLYAGTAYVTSVNSAPVSAERAGNAANAALANSAWYDGTGRYISALPDSAAVSAIASGYAESAVSSKADSSALSSYALSADVSGCIDTVSGNSASWGAGASLPITGSAGTESGTYNVTAVEFTRNDTQGEPDIRTATYSIDGLNMSYTIDNVNYTGVTMNETGIEFSDPDGYTSLSPADIDNWNGKQDALTIYGIPSASAITSIDGSSVRAGGLLPNAVQAGGDSYGNTVFMPTATIFPNGGFLSPLTFAVSAGMSVSAGPNRASYRGDTVFLSNEYDPDNTEFNTSVSTGLFTGSYVRLEAHRSRGSNLSLTSTNSPGGAYTGTTTGCYSSTGNYKTTSVDLRTTCDSGWTGITPSSVRAQFDTNGITMSATYTGGDWYRAKLTRSALSFADSATTAEMQLSSIGYWNDKQDASAMSAYALSADVSGVIDTVSSNSATWGGGGATGDYVEKSSYQHSLGTANTVTGTSTASVYLINGSSISANLGGAYVQFVNGLNNTANKNAFINGYGNRASGNGATFGLNSTAWDNSITVGGSQYAEYDALAIGAYGSTAKSNALSIGGGNSASGFGFALGSGLNAKKYVLALGSYNSAYDGTSVALVIGDGYVYNDGGWKTARHDLMVVTKDGEITMYSSTADTTGTGIMSAIRAISAAATGGGGGGIDSATCSAIASAYAESAVSSKADSSALSSYALSADVSGCIDTVSANSASWGGGIDSATCSAIASSYAESAASSKQDSSGMTAYMFNSAMQVVANSSQATANGVLYILTGGV